MKTYSAKATLAAEPIDIKAELAEGESGPPSFSGTAYSGGMVPGYTAKLAYPYVIDLSATTKARSVHANLEHKPDKLVGHVSTVTNDGKTLHVEGFLSAETQYSEQVAKSARNGMPWEVSIECALGGGKLIPKGKSAVINGQKFDGPFIHMTKNRFTDIAFVSHGADGGNEVKIAASTAGEFEMTDFDKFMAACGVDPEAATDENKANLRIAFEAKSKLSEKTETAAKSFEQTANEHRANRERCQAIAKLAETAMREHPMYIEQIEGMARLAMEGDSTPSEFELELFRNTRTVTGSFHGGTSQRQSDPKIIECALSMASGLPNIEKHYSEESLDTVERLGMRNFGIQQMLLMSATSNGYVCRAGERITTGNLREVLEYAFPATTARLSGFSGISMSGILGNVGNKEIVEGYKEEDQTWREITTVKSVSNFHAVTSYRMLDSLEYEEVGPAGEIKHGTLDQESYTRQAKTYARMLGLTRQDIINDDLGAFNDIRERLGRGGAKKFGNILWATFINNSNHFTAGRTNFIDGATTNLGVDGVGLALGLKAYRSMTTPSADGKKRIGAGMDRPTVLLVPPELEVIARKFYQSMNLITGADTTLPDANIFHNLFRPVVQNRLSDTAYTGYSATAWYLLGGGLKPMVASFLNGQQMPTIESADADFNTLGIQFRGVHDFGCDLGEYLVGIKSKGAA